MSPQAQHFLQEIESARKGSGRAMLFVRSICRMAVEKAPDEDLLLIAEAIAKVSSQFGPDAFDTGKN